MEYTTSHAHAPQLNATHRAHLAQSALSETVIQARGYETIDGEGAYARLKSLGFSKRQALLTPGLLIPLYDLQGHQRPEYHYRPDTPDFTPKGKARKYEYPPDTPLVIDCPPGCAEALRDVALPLWITEGEKKEDSLVSAGAQAVLGFLGVYGWRSAHGVSPEFEHIALRGRDVRLCYDSDMVHNPQVRKALGRFAGWLTHHGAIVWVLHLPSPSGAKAGVDDFLAAPHCLADIEALLRPWEAEAASAQVPPSTFAPHHTPYGDVWNAEQLAERHGQEFAFCPPLGGWLAWTGTHWEVDALGRLMEAARQTLRACGAEAAQQEDAKRLQHIARCFTHGRLTAMVAQAETLAPFPRLPSEFDTDPWVLNCANGTLNLRTQTLHPHQREEYLTRCTPVAYIPEATCWQWEHFLWRVMGGGHDDLDEPFEATEASTELIGFLQRAVGYSLVGTPVEDCLFLLHGHGRNGKSVFLSLLHEMLGPSYAKTAHMESFLHRDRENTRHDLADLHGARLVSAVETDEGKRMAEGIIKQLTGGDPIKARFLFHEYFTFLPQFTLFLAFNHEPQIRGTDPAIWERIYKVPWTVYIPPEDRDKYLREKLKQELPGILAWAVEGCRQWQAQGLQPPAAVVQATQEYKEGSNVVWQFLEECCEKAKQDKVFVRDLYSAYTFWGRTSNEYVISKKRFTMALKELKLPLEISGGYPYVPGKRLKNEAVPQASNGSKQYKEN